MRATSKSHYKIITLKQCSIMAIFSIQCITVNVTINSLGIIAIYESDDTP
jgi:hypothetical protein